MSGRDNLLAGAVLPVSPLSPEKAHGRIHVLRCHFTSHCAPAEGEQFVDGMQSRLKLTRGAWDSAKDSAKDSA